jgi:hypothetical protein
LAKGDPANAGSIGDNEMYSGTGAHNFAGKLKPALDRLLAARIKPIIVLGNTPIALSNRRPAHTPSWNTDSDMGGDGVLRLVSMRMWANLPGVQAITALLDTTIISNPFSNT